jgi:peptidoglycan hydrolase-like protein with peptidoglycan-binding domain
MKSIKYFFIICMVVLSGSCIQKVSALETAPPVISDVAVPVSGLTSSSADIFWNTDKLTTSRITYGLTPDVELIVSNSIFTNIHTMSLGPLVENSLYYYCIYSTDELNNTTKHCGGTFSTLPEIPNDVTPPTISEITVSDITASSVKISWTTDEVTTTKVLYGTNQEYDNSFESSDLVTSHVVVLTHLVENTQYNFSINSFDGSGNKGYSGNTTFTTSSSGSGNISAPQILSIITSSINHHSVTISWTTDQAATSRIEYGTDESYGSFTTLDTDLVTDHRQILVGLTANTHYHFRVISSNSANHTSTSRDQLFTTLTSPVVIDEAPIISFVSASLVSSSSVRISWMTNEASYSQVEYGLTTSYGSATLMTQNLVTLHSQTISGLLPGTLYHYRVVSKDSGNNFSYSIDQTFTTATSGGEGHTTPIAVVPQQTLKNKIKDSTVSFSLDNIQAIGLDKLIMFTWTNPKDINFGGVRFVRSSTNYPETPTQGDLVYNGQATIFSDLGLNNGKMYYYSVFTYDKDMNIVGITKLAIAPYAEKKHYHVLHISSLGVSASTLHLTKDLSFGDSHDEVGHAQELLSLEPSLYPDGLITGFFGVKTEKAIKQLQLKYNLPVTGKIDGSVRAILLGFQKNQTLIEHEHKDTIRALSSDIVYGMDTEEVKVLQQYLMEKGYLHTKEPTGYFGSLTKDAVIKFQIKNNISPAVGYVGPITRAKILENISSILGEATMD